MRAAVAPAQAGVALALRKQSTCTSGACTTRPTTTPAVYKSQQVVKIFKTFWYRVKALHK